MDTLPVELLHQILRDCDAASVCSLRLLTRTFADLGYDYLLASNFCTQPWRDGCARLRAIASHQRLRSKISSLTFNFAQVDIEHVRETLDAKLARDPKNVALNRTRDQLADFEHRHLDISPLYAEDPADLAVTFRSLFNLQDIAVTFQQAPVTVSGTQEGTTDGLGLKMNHDDAIKRLNVLMAALQLASAPRHAPPSSSISGQSSRSNASSTSFSSPPNISPSSVYASTSAPASAATSATSAHGSSPTSSPFSSPPSSTPGSPSTTNTEACTDRCRLTCLSIDRLPLEVLRNQLTRRLWFQSRNVFGGLTRLDLTLETSNVNLPSAKFKAVNGLGYVLRMAPHLTHLSLDFRSDHSTWEAFVLPLRELLGESDSLDRRPLPLPLPLPAYNGSGRSGVADTNGHTAFHFRALTDLKLSGIDCDEADLRGFLLRHASTLERLRLGGRGCTHNWRQKKVGGMQLSNGTFSSFFRSLRGGRLPRLQQMHLEGVFFCLANSLSGEAHSLPATSVAASPSIARPRCESYNFRPTSDDNWDPVPEEAMHRTSIEYSTSERFEAYVLGHTDEYPGSIRLQSDLRS
ncbi:MAG: hypothetical protein SEPTF4163_000690 [Sporothrix epigloea]